MADSSESRIVSVMAVVLYIVAAVILGPSAIEKVKLLVKNYRQGDSADAGRLPRQIHGREFYGIAHSGLLIGSEDAPITVVVYSNCYCGYCAEFSVTLARLREKYPDHVAL
jgi:thiol-disulfide isomerase/thioredoxin